MFWCNMLQMQCGSWHTACEYTSVNPIADPKKSARTAKNTGVGLSWYLSQNVKLMADYEETKFDGGAVDGDRPTEKFVSTRAQLSF